MKAANTDQGLSQPLRFFLKGLCLLLVVLLLAGAASFPFLYPSTSLWYRFDTQKTILRTGKIFGLLAATLFFLQPLLSLRPKFLERIFPAKLLYDSHRKSGLLLCCLALLHPLIIFWLEDIKNFPVQMRYWPEMVGGFLLVLLWLVYSTARWRTFLLLSFARWRHLHLGATSLAAVLIGVHVYNVSDTFQKFDTPRRALFAALGLYAMQWIGKRIRNLKKP